jgi:hypothetical protein
VTREDIYSTTVREPMVITAAAVGESTAADFVEPVNFVTG